MSKPIPRGLMSIASSAAADAMYHNVGALHVGCQILDAVPDGWAKTKGLWSQDTDGGEKRDNYRQEVVKLFWEWYINNSVETWRDDDKKALRIAAQQRAYILGIDLKEEGGEWRPA